MSRLLMIVMAVALASADETVNKTAKKTEDELVRNSRGVLLGDHSRLYGIVDAAVNAASSLTGLVGVGSKGSASTSGDTYELVEVPRPSDNRIGTGAQSSGQVSSSSSATGSYQPCWPASNPNQGPTVTRRVVGQNRRQLGDGPIRHPPVTVSRGPSTQKCDGPSVQTSSGSSVQTSGGSSVAVSRGPIHHPPVTVSRGPSMKTYSGSSTQTYSGSSTQTYGGPSVKTSGGPSVKTSGGPSMTVSRGPLLSSFGGSSLPASGDSSVKAPIVPPASSGWKFAPSSLLSLAMPFKGNSPTAPERNPIVPSPTSPPRNCQTICMPACPPPPTCPPPPPPQIEYVHIEHPPQIIEQVVEHHIEHPPQLIETVVEHHIEHPPRIIEQVVEHHIEHPPEIIETVVEHHIEHPPKIIEHTQRVVEKVPQVMMPKPVQQPKSKSKFF